MRALERSGEDGVGGENSESRPSSDSAIIEA